MKIIALGLLVALSVVVISCRPTSSGKEQRYELKGKVVSVEVEKHQVTVAHEEVKDFMPAMTMPFTLKDQESLKFLQAGDQISAILVVDGAESWLEQPVITRQAEIPGATTVGVTPAKPGDEVPDFPMVNQDGKDIRIRGYRGKALLLTFIYTRCPLPEYCDLMSNNFAKVDRQLQQQPDVYTKTHLLSISIDPEYDTPKVLKSYGAAHTERYQEETFKHWEFATGTKDQIKNVAQFFGLRYFQATDQIQHNLATVLVGPDGKVVRVWDDNKWRPDEVSGEMVKAASGSK